MTHKIDQRARELFLKHATQGALIEEIAHAALTEALTRIEELEGALEPFVEYAKDAGPQDDDVGLEVILSGGNNPDLTWGDFRIAHAALTQGIKE